MSETRTLIRGKAIRHAIVFLTPENGLEAVTDEYGQEVQFTERADAEAFVKANEAKGLLMIQPTAKRVYRRNTGVHLTPDVPVATPKGKATVEMPGAGVTAAVEATV